MPVTFTSPITADAPGIWPAYRGGCEAQPALRRRCRPGAQAAVASSHRSASMAAIHPVPAAVMAWRYVWSWTSPHANTPGHIGGASKSGCRQEVAGLVHVQLAGEQVRIRHVADGDEHARRRAERSLPR